MRRWSRSTCVVAAAVGLLLPLCGRADAVTGFGPAYTLTSKTCVGLWTSEGANGVSRGFADCVWHPIVNVAGSGSDWHISYAPKSWGAGLRAAASDGSTDYAIMIGNTGGLYLRYRTRDGVYHPGQRLSKNGSGAAALVVSEGHWWAVWTEADGVHEAHTLGGTRASHLIFKTDGPSNAQDSDTALAWNGHQATLAWTHAVGNNQATTRLSTSTGGDWTPYRTLSGMGFGLDVTYTGSTIAVVRTEGVFGKGKIAMFTGSPTGTLSKHLSSYPAGGSQPKVAYSRGRLNVAWNWDIDGNRNAQIVAERTNGVWTESRLAGPANTRVMDLTSTGGHARLFVAYGQELIYARTQK